ncbi:MAG: hypothetical protein DMG06_30375 [Acidobacteria bacterium]|nr:MAG: hypothetical protein DMG06_30375 [Acidobacteriota bacterium]
MHKTLDSAQFRKVMARFVTGVTIVTSRAGEEVHGMTCNAFCSISIAPLTVMVCLTKNSRTERLIEKGRVFAVNVKSFRWLGLDHGGYWGAHFRGKPSLRGLQTHENL